jgi:hypothetical protein
MTLFIRLELLGAKIFDRRENAASNCQSSLQPEKSLIKYSRSSTAKSFALSASKHSQASRDAKSTSRIGKSFFVRLAYFAARFSEENIVIGIGVKRRIKIDEIDAGIGKFFRVPQPAKVVAEVKAVRHLIRLCVTNCLRSTGSIRCFLPSGPHDFE